MGGKTVTTTRNVKNRTDQLHGPTNVEPRTNLHWQEMKINPATTDAITMVELTILTGPVPVDMGFGNLKGRFGGRCIFATRTLRPNLLTTPWLRNRVRL